MLSISSSKKELIMKLIYTLLFGVISVALIACTSNTSVNTEETTKEKMSRLDKETKALISPVNCLSTDQCHSVGFGHKPCGGFNAYRIYSDVNTDTSLLKSKIKQYNVLSKILNKKNNLASNCMMLIQPKLACITGTCQIK